MCGRVRYTHTHTHTHTERETRTEMNRDREKGVRETEWPRDGQAASEKEAEKERK